jgi:hypothetical protein
MRQVTLATAGFERSATTTCRILVEMERMVPWRALCLCEAGQCRRSGGGADVAHLLFCSSGSICRTRGQGSALARSEIGHR